MRANRDDIAQAGNGGPDFTPLAPTPEPSAEADAALDPIHTRVYGYTLKEVGDGLAYATRHGWAAGMPASQRPPATPPLDVELLAGALVKATREQAGEPDGEGWPGYVYFGSPRDVSVVLNVNELSEAIAREYAALANPTPEDNA